VRVLTRVFLAAVIGVPASAARADDAAVKLTVAPPAALRPALHYQLLPEVRELTPGNAAQWYFRCFQEQRNFFGSKQVSDERARYRVMPLADLPAEQLRHYGGSALTQADWGARLDTCDWQALQRVQSEGLDLPLPEVEPLKVLGTALQVRFRGQMAGRHYDEAVGTAKTMFALARHLGEYPAAPANRAGLTIAALALDSLGEMVQQPGCPNLYWALTDLPAPLVDVRKGLQGHRVQVATELKALRDDAAMTPAAAADLVGRLSGGLGYEREQAGKPPRNLRAELKARADDPARVRAARRRLVDDGRSWVTLALFPPAQVILLDEQRAYEIDRDEALKLLALPPAQAEALAAMPAGEPGLFADLVPDVAGLRRARAKVDQRVAALRHVEALRMYAAGHGGQLPPSLADVGLPLPADPVTGTPFSYTLDGPTAHLRGADGVHFEINVRK
jgi:hypothetical protein